MTSERRFLEHLELMERTAAAMADHSSVVAELLRGAQRDHVIASELVTLKQDDGLAAGWGVREKTSAIPQASVAIFNLGTMTATVQNAGRSRSLPGEGRGILKVPAGGFVCAPLAGNELTMYGRTGEQLVVVRYSHAVPPAMGSAATAPYASVNIVPVAGVFTYAAPWGQPPIYCGFTAVDSAAAAGVADATEFVISDGLLGTPLEEVVLDGKQSSAIEYVNGKQCTQSSIAVLVTKGSFLGSLAVR